MSSLRRFTALIEHSRARAIDALRDVQRKHDDDRAPDRRERQTRR